MGHFIRVCTKTTNVNRVAIAEDQSESSNYEDSYLYYVGIEGYHGRPMEEVQINGAKVAVLVDSGLWCGGARSLRYTWQAHGSEPSRTTEQCSSYSATQTPSHQPESRGGPCGSLYSTVKSCTGRVNIT